MLTPDRIDKIYEIGVKDIRVSLHTTNPDSYGRVMNYKSNKVFVYLKYLPFYINYQ